MVVVGGGGGGVHSVIIRELPKITFVISSRFPGGFYSKPVALY